MQIAFNQYVEIFKSQDDLISKFGQQINHFNTCLSVVDSQLQISEEINNNLYNFNLADIQDYIKTILEENKYLKGKIFIMFLNFSKILL